MLWGATARLAQAELRAAGSYSNQPNLTHADNCTICPRGSYCGLGSTQPKLAEIGTYAANEGQDRPTECRDTNPGTTIAAVGAKGREECVCKAGQYDRDNGTDTTECVDCSYESTDCVQVGAGVTLQSLPLKYGYWRAFERAERSSGSDQAGVFRRSRNRRMIRSRRP